MFLFLFCWFDGDCYLRVFGVLFAGTDRIAAVELNVSLWWNPLTLPFCIHRPLIAIRLSLSCSPYIFCEFMKMNVLHCFNAHRLYGDEVDNDGKRRNWLFLWQLILSQTVSAFHLSCFALIFDSEGL